jgi:hypothetical protein
MNWTPEGNKSDESDHRPRQRLHQFRYYVARVRRFRGDVFMRWILHGAMPTFFGARSPSTVEEHATSGRLAQKGKLILSLDRRTGKKFLLCPFPLAVGAARPIRLL